MMPASDTDEGDRRRTRCAKSGKRYKAGRSGDADLRDFFGSVDHEKLLTLVVQRIADGRVLCLIKAMLKAGSYGKGRLFPSERGTPQGGVITPRTQTITRIGTCLGRGSGKRSWIGGLRLGVC